MGNKNPGNKHGLRRVIQKTANFNGDYWLNELEKHLNAFGASIFDLPEIDPDSCQTEKQFEHAIRVRARFLVHQIREIETELAGEEAEQVFRGLMDRVCLIDDGPAWFAVEKRSGTE